MLTSNRQSAVRPDDRRRTRRLQRLIRLDLQEEGAPISLVTTDLSAAGAFLHTPHALRLTVGRPISLRYATRLRPALIMRAVVTRVMLPSRVTRVPGVAVEFVEVHSPGGVDPLTAFLETVVGHRIPRALFDCIERRGDGATYWPPGRSPAAARMVHAERAAPHRTLPDDARAAEDLLHRWATDVERRRVRRFPVHEEVRYFFGDLPHLGRVLNISRHGLFIQTDHELPPVGGRVNLRYVVTDEPDALYVKLAGRVSRHWEPGSEGLPGFGLRIDAVDEQRRIGLYRMYLRRLRG